MSYLAALQLAAWRIALAMLVSVFAMPDTCASEPAPLAGEAGELQVFVRDGCPHCANAKAFLPGFMAAYPDITVVYRPVDRDVAARDELVRLSRAAGAWPPGVPAFAFQGQLVTGFADDGSSHKKLVALLTSRHQPHDTIDTGLFGTLSVDRLGLPLFTLAIGLLDGFNPCAMWVLLFLLSMLVHLHDRRTMALVAGTFVLVSGGVYYLFMAAWLNVFLAVGFSDVIRLALASLAIFIGIVNTKDFIVPGKGLSLSIPAAVKPDIYSRVRHILQGQSLLLSLMAVASLAVLVNVVELLCTAGLPAIYTAILTRQGLEGITYYGYLGLYILGYIFDDSLMVGSAVYALNISKLSGQAGRWLKLLSGAVMLSLGLLLLLRPDWLL